MNQVAQRNLIQVARAVPRLARLSPVRAKWAKTAPRADENIVNAVNELFNVWA